MIPASRVACFQALFVNSQAIGSPRYVKQNTGCLFRSASNTSTASRFRGTPRGVPFLVRSSHPVPFETGNLAGAAASRQRKANQRLQVRRCGRDEAIGFILGQPAIPFVLTRQQTNLRNHFQPLPLIASRPQQVANRGELAVHRRRLVAPLQLRLGDVPDHVARDLAQLQRSQVRVEAATNAPNVLEAPQMLLA